MRPCVQFVREPVSRCDASVVEHLARWRRHPLNVFALSHPRSSIPCGLY